MIQKLWFAGLATVALSLPCQGADTINPADHLAALVATDRAPRSWKFLKLVPGKVTYWYYQYVLADGSTVTRVTNAPIKQAPDRRPLRESHPDLAILVPGVQTSSSAALNTLWLFRR